MDSASNKQAIKHRHVFSQCHSEIRVLGRPTDSRSSNRRGYAVRGEDVPANIVRVGGGIDVCMVRTSRKYTSERNLLGNGEPPQPDDNLRTQKVG
jgi:hypothetical protein